MASAEDFGRKLLGEIEVVGLDEILQSLRLQNEEESTGYFNFAPLDRLVRTAVEAKPQTSKSAFAQPIVELMSLAPGGGKTHLLYHLCAQAVLPTALSGKQTCIVMIDANGNFSVNRLAAQLEYLIRKHQPASAAADEEKKIEELILTSLKHIHIFHPQTLAGTISTIDSLPSYLFNSNRHSSFDRAVGFIALDSASAFYWQDRAETEDAAFLSSSATTIGGPKPPPKTQSAYIALTSSIKSACKIFTCPAIFTTWHLGSWLTTQEQRAQHSRSFRPSFPAPFAHLPTLRMFVQRKAVRKFPPGTSVMDALREGAMRQKAVEEGKFECFVNEWEVDERVVRKLRGCVGGGGFEFKIGGMGVVVEEEYGEEG